MTSGPSSAPTDTPTAAGLATEEGGGANRSDATGPGPKAWQHRSLLHGVLGNARPVDHPTERWRWSFGDHNRATFTGAKAAQRGPIGS